MNKIISVILLLVLLIVGLVLFQEEADTPTRFPPAKEKATISMPPDTMSKKHALKDRSHPLKSMPPVSESKADQQRIEPFSPYEEHDGKGAVPIKGVMPEIVFSVDFSAIKTLKKGDTLLIPAIAGNEPVEVMIQESKSGISNTTILRASLDADSQKSTQDFAYLVTGDKSAMITLKNGEKVWTGIITQNGIGRFYDRSKIDATQRFDRPDTKTIPIQKGENNDAQ